MFQPYDLTPLDHFAPAVHVNATFTFSLTDKDHVEVFQRVEDATARLISKLPFLTGMVVPSTQPDGRSNTFQVRPATAAELKERPILVIQHHTEFTALTVDGKNNPALMPFPIVYPRRNPSPVLRLKANIIGDKLHLVSCIDHLAIDGSGLFTLISAFAAFCRDPNAPRPSITPHAQEEIRQHIREIASTVTPQDLQWTTFPPVTIEDQISTSFSREGISSHLVLDGRKIEMLHDACNSALRSPPGTSLPPGLIVSALLGICSSRARLRAFPDQKPSSEMFIIANIRKALDLPRRYIGNAIVGVQSTCEVSANPPPEALRNIHVPKPLSPVGPEDIWRICNIAQTLQKEEGNLDKESAQGMVATMSHERDWSSFQPRKASPYTSYGPLGDLELFDLSFDTVPGFCWMMPNLPSDSPSPYLCWRLRWVLERAAMDCLLSDPLFQWASTPSAGSVRANIYAK
ncbi:unnamed protein product [Penicillium glandicola]